MNNKIRMKISLITTTIALLCCLCIPAWGGNWYLGGGLEYVDVGDDLGDIVDSGYGLSFNFGYRFSEWFALDMSFAGSAHDDIDGDDLTYGRFSIGPLFIFNSPSQFQPYLTIGLASHFLEWDDFDIEATGGSLFLGTGFDYYFTQNHSIDVGLRYHTWEADVDIGGFPSVDVDATTTTLTILYNYHFVW